MAFRARRSVAAAIRWYVKLLDAIGSLADNPELCGLAPENEWFPDMRQKMFGKKRDVYRILFEIRGNTVFILRVRHGSQDLLQPDLPG